MRRMIRCPGRSVLALAGLAAAAFVTLPAHSAAASYTGHPWTFNFGSGHPNYYKARGSFILDSPNHVYRAIFQADCNFVVYHDRRGPIWHTNTRRTDGQCVLGFVGRADIRVYNTDDRPAGLITMWYNHPKYPNTGNPQQLRMQNDGNLVQYSMDLGSPVRVEWATGTNGR